MESNEFNSMIGGYVAGNALSKTVFSCTKDSLSRSDITYWFCYSSYTYYYLLLDERNKEASLYSRYSEHNELGPIKVIGAALFQDGRRAEGRGVLPQCVCGGAHLCSQG